MKQIIEKLKEKMGVAKNLHVQSGYPAQVHLSPDEARQIVEALEGNKCEMTSERIREIQESTAYAQSISVKKALLQVWHECVTGISKKSVQEKMLKDLSAKELEDDVNRNKI